MACVLASSSPGHLDLRRRVHACMRYAGVPVATPVAGTAVPTAVVEPTGAVEVFVDGLPSLVPSYKVFKGADYSLSQVPPPAVFIKDVKPGIPAETVQECAEKCNKHRLCNAASYYGNNPIKTWPLGQPCWLKTIGVPCELPADYEPPEQPGTVFMLAQEDCRAPLPRLPCSQVTPIACHDHKGTRGHPMLT